MKTWLDLFKTREKKAVLYLGMLMAAGVMMMLAGKLPLFSGGGNTARGEPEAAAELTLEKGAEPEPGWTDQERQLEKRLEEIFALVEGVGQTRVMLTYQPGKETVYAADSSISEAVSQETDAQGGSRQTQNKTQQDKTILITDRSGEERPLVLREIEPGITGVVIIAEGGDSVFVKDALTKAACTVLGIAANKVQVLKMTTAPNGESKQWKGE